MLQRQTDLPAVKRVLRGKHDLRRNVFLRQHTCRAGTLEAAAQIGHGADEALDLALAVADGHIGQNVADVAEFDLDAVFVAQQIIDLDPGQAEPERVDGQLRDVEVEKARSVDALFGERIVIADGVDLRAGILRQRSDARHGLLPAQGQIPARNVQACQQQVRCACRLCQVDHGADIALAHGRTDEQHGALRQAAAGLVHADGRHIRPRCHGGNGQRVRERKMRTVSFVRQHAHAVCVGQLHDASQIRADAVIRRIVHEDSLRVRIGLDGALHVGKRHAQRDAELRIDARINIDRHGTAQHERIDGTAVHIARHDDLIAPFAHAQDHGLHGAGRSADHEESMCCTEGLRCQHLGVVDDGPRVAGVVEWLHGVDVGIHCGLPEELRQLRIPLPVLVARHIERNDALFGKGTQSLEDRRACLRKLVFHINRCSFR